MVRFVWRVPAGHGGKDLVGPSTIIYPSVCAIQTMCHSDNLQMPKGDKENTAMGLSLHFEY